MITIHDVEHPRSITRRIKACLTLVGAAAAGVLALTATSPAANADTADIPSLPIGSGDETGPESLGIPPLFDGSAFEQNGQLASRRIQRVLDEVNARLKIR
jgi:hypothetical protein